MALVLAAAGCASPTDEGAAVAGLRFDPDVLAPGDAGRLVASLVVPASSPLVLRARVVDGPDIELVAAPGDAEAQGSWTPDRLGEREARVGEARAFVRVLLPMDEPAAPGDLGTPAAKRASAGSFTDDLALDASFDVHERGIHGTRVVVAIHQSLRDVGDAAAFAESVFDGFESFWAVFQGHAFDEYRVVLRGMDDPCAFQGAGPSGFPVCVGDHSLDASDPSRPPHPLTTGGSVLVLHELFHSWNGGTLQAVPRDVEGFTEEAWFVEGVTNYYAARALATPLDASGYLEEMASHARDLEEARTSTGDVTFAQAASRTPRPGEGHTPHVAYLYARGALVAYALDVELAAKGQDLDDVLRVLWRDFAVPGEPFSSADVERAALDVGGDDLAVFFDRFVWGAEQAPPVTGFVDHKTPRHRVLAAP